MRRDTIDFVHPGYTGDALMLGTIISAVVVGLGSLAFMWWRGVQAARTKAKADSLESAAKGEVQAGQTEGVLLDEMDSNNAQPKDATDIR
jgi:hypothetical protein